MTKAFLISSLILLFSIAVVQTAVIGIDFGTEFYKISLISPGKSFIIIENTTTKRKTPTAVNILKLNSVRYFFLV